MAPQNFASPAIAPQVSAERYIALGSDGRVFHTLADGRSSLLGSNGFGGNSLAKNSAGVFFTVANLANGVSPLVEIDPKTGRGSPVAQFSNLDVRGLAFSAKGELFAVSEPSLPVYELFKLDMETGQETLVGRSVFSAIQGLDFSSDGTLYGWDLEDGLVIIDSKTGEVADVNAAVGADVDIQSIVFTGDGSLLGGRDALYKIDVETGETTFVGEGGYSDLRGLAIALADVETALARSSLLGLAYDGSIFQLGEDGSGTLLSNIGLGGNSLASNAAGELFTVSGVSERDRTLIKIELATGLGQIVTPVESSDIRGLAFSLEDELFGIRLFSGPAAGDDLYKLDSQTGQQTFVGSTIGFTTIEGLDFAPDGTLYGWDLESGLVTIDVETGAATDINPDVGADVPIQGIVFANDGRLFGSRDALYEINVATGETTYLGNSDYSSIRGLEIRTDAATGATSKSGTHQEDVLTGARADDSLNGWGGSDQLLGKAGNDTLNGGGGKDRIKGGGGDDILGGGQGRDTLMGNGGRDIFVLAVRQGRDTILDFKGGVDSLGLTDGLSFGDLDIVGRANNTLIRYDNRTLASLANVSAATIGVEDFTLL